MRSRQEIEDRECRIVIWRKIEPALRFESKVTSVPVYEMKRRRTYSSASSPHTCFQVLMAQIFEIGSQFKRSMQDARAHRNADDCSFRDEITINIFITRGVSRSKWDRGHQPQRLHILIRIHHNNVLWEYWPPYYSNNRQSLSISDSMKQDLHNTVKPL